ncbi:MAG TPA: DMT family transporter [Nocardioidaceae bacterium]|nr:DMT family transporter [Nocardioidaceae bacterium]
MSEPRSRLQAFGMLDWALLGVVAAMWGSSFLLIEIGLEHLEPTAVACLRLLFGAAAVAVVPAARRPIPRRDWPLVAVLGLVWMAIPFLLFPLAQQSISSSLAGMVNGAAPLFTVVIASLWSRSPPTGRQLIGLLVGFGGVLVVNWPAAQGTGATVLGAGLVVIATLLYGVAFNLAVPLEERNGALPVIWRAQLVALLLVTPAGAFGLADSTLAWSSMLAMVVLGALSTGVAFVAFTTLVGRVGAPRGSVTVYFIPIVAIVLGIVVRDEAVAAVAFLGTALILVGAYLTSRTDAAERP